MKNLKYLPVIAVFIPFLVNGCTSSILVKSTWNNNETVIDGKDNDWDDTMFYIPDAQITTGLRNDSNNVYIILKATDRRQAFQIMGLGLTVWFDPSGGTSEKFGIHFPLGRNGERGTMQESGGYDPDSSQNQYPGIQEMTPNELEVLGANENGPVRLTIADTKGIELQLNRQSDGLIYELKVPLHKSPEHPYAVNVSGSTLGIGFEGGKFEARENGGSGGRRTRGGEEGGGMGPGGEGGGGGVPGEGGGRGMGRGGRGRSYEEGGQNQQPKQIDFWLKVRLATPTTVTAN